MILLPTEYFFPSSRDMQSVNRFHLTAPHQADRVKFTKSPGRRKEGEGKVLAKSMQATLLMVL